MRFLVDICIGNFVVDWLNSLGHEGIFVGSRNASMLDDNILSWANSESRIVVTGDKDFGRLAIRDQKSHCGIILLPMVRIQERIILLQHVLSHHIEQSNLSYNCAAFDPS